MAYIWVLEEEGGEYDDLYTALIGVFSDPALAMEWADEEYSNTLTSWVCDEDGFYLLLDHRPPYGQYLNVTVRPMEIDPT